MAEAAPGLQRQCAQIGRPDMVNAPLTIFVGSPERGRPV